MGKSAPKTPPAPDPRVVSQAQADANIQSATAQQKLNLINTYGPQGSVVYGADPNAPGGYSQTTSLSPQEQAIYNAQKATELGATNIAQGQLGRVEGALATPLSTDGLPALQGGVNAAPIRSNFDQGQAVQVSFDPGGAVQTNVDVRNSFGMGGPLQYGFDQGQQVQGQVGGDLEAARRNAENAVYQQATSRLDPRFAQEDNALRTRLANQGMSQNSTAYATAQENQGRIKNDAYNQAQYSAIGAGEQAAQAQFQRQLGQGQFANDAAAQMYGQNLGAAQFNNATAGQDYSQNKGAAEFFNSANLAQMEAQNAAQAQQFGQNQNQALFGNQAAGQQYQQGMGAAEFYNQGQNQAFNQGTANAQLANTARNQGLQERAYLQNQPINQLTGLLGLGQVGMPTGVNYTPSQVGQTDVTGAYALQQQALQANANRASQSQSGLMGGLMGLGQAAIMASDRRLKDNIVHLATRRDGLKVYSFTYLNDNTPQVGVMADEVKRIRPDLVVRRADGFMAVNYAALA